MTIKDYKAMILLETGNVITTATAKDLMSVDREHEAEAVTCGRYDVEPIDTPKRLHSEWCWEAMQAGADCRCGLFSYEDEQDVLPDLSADAREMLISGMCGKCFDKLFEDEE